MTTGYKTVTPIELGNLLHALKAGAIAWSGARVWFACLEMVAIREAARRSAPARRDRSVPTPDFTLDEIVARTGLAPRVTRRTVGRLERLGLLTLSRTAIPFAPDPLPEASSLIETIAGGRSPRRPIPMPRRLARHLASGPDATAGHVMLGYVLRGLSLERGTGEIRSAGTVKAGWLADTLGLGLRTVRSAQARLRSLGWIGKDTGSRQWKLNRDGAWFRIDPDWQAPVADTLAAPRRVESDTRAAPPKEDRKTPSEFKDQRTQPGAFGMGNGKDLQKYPEPSSAPKLTNIHLTDLHDRERLLSLHRQAVISGWLQDCEADTLNFFGAAIRARSTSARDPVRVFVALVRQRRWKHITQAHEDEARRMVRAPAPFAKLPATSHGLGAILRSLLPDSVQARMPVPATKQAVLHLG